jgi:DNA-binding FadR family transcriptional regulator
MEQFGVRRNTIRETLRILETTGSIKVKARALKSMPMEMEG